MINIADNTWLLDYSEFSSDGYYDLKPGETLVFPWQVKPESYTETTITQTNLSAQDHTVQAWLSRKPVDDVMFYPMVNYMTNLVASRNGTVIDVYDTNDKNHLLKAQSGKQYFLNVKNLANEHNSFKLTFSWTATTTTVPSKPVSNNVTPSEKVGTSTKYGEIVAQLPHGLTIVKSNDNGTLFSLMRNDEIIASVKLKPSDIKGMQDITATYVDGSKKESAYLHYLVEYLVTDSILDIQLMDASMNKNFWDNLLAASGKLKLSLWDKATGNKDSLNKEKLNCETLWERDPNLYLLIS